MQSSNLSMLGNDPGGIFFFFLPLILFVALQQTMGLTLMRQVIFVAWHLPIFNIFVDFSEPIVCVLIILGSSGNGY
jgi:hypothetical protein